MTDHPPPRRSPMAGAPRVDPADRPDAAELDEQRREATARRQRPSRLEEANP